MDFLHAVGSVLAPLVVPATILGAAWLHKAVSASPTDLERAQHLSRMATDAAALVVSINPSSSRAELLRQVVNMLASATATPTDNADALNRAAAGALTEAIHKDALVQTARTALAAMSSTPPPQPRA